MRTHPREKEKAKRQERARRFKLLLEEFTLAEIGAMQTPPISTARVQFLVKSLDRDAEQEAARAKKKNKK